MKVSQLQATKFGGVVPVSRFVDIHEQTSSDTTPPEIVDTDMIKSITQMTSSAASGSAKVNERVLLIARNPKSAHTYISRGVKAVLFCSTKTFATLDAIVKASYTAVRAFDNVQLRWRWAMCSYG